MTEPSLQAEVAELRRQLAEVRGIAEDALALVRQLIEGPARTPEDSHAENRQRRAQRRRELGLG